MEIEELAEAGVEEGFEMALKRTGEGGPAVEEYAKTSSSAKGFCRLRSQKTETPGRIL